MPPRLFKLPYVAAVGTSSFLLFTLELFAGREVLPVFGGAPGVWATALCFFSGVLFLGYAYAHASATRLSARRGGVVHLLLAVVLVALSTQAPNNLQTLRLAGTAEALNVLLALGVTAGPPAFLLASTTPLLSAWFARTSPNAWWLYAASNGASLLGLLAYPFLIEPRLPLSAQRSVIVGGLVVFAVLVLVIVLRERRAATARVSEPNPVAEPQDANEAVGTGRILWWLIAAFVPAGLLTATTTFLATDLVSAPLLWVGPLAIYLASFVVAFSERLRAVLPAVDRLVPAAATLLWLPFVLPVGWPVAPLVVIVLGSFAVLAVAVHGRLAQDRPAAGHLTKFYLVMSAAGVLATALVGIVAPVVLSDVYEYPFLLVAGPAVLALLRSPYRRWLPDMRRPLAIVRDMGLRLAPYIAASALLIVTTGRIDAGTFSLLIFGGTVVAIALTPRLLAVVTPVALVMALVMLTSSPLKTVLFQGRSFFGVSKVVSLADRNDLYSGTTLHGVQLVGDKRGVPSTYYTQPGPIGDVFGDLAQRSAGAVIGVVGLGSGTIATYLRPTDSLTFFEIDPLVIDVASNPAYFSYIRDASGPTRIVEGDGRLSLATWPAESFDLLLLDAFSSDSVPPHLLTAEAIATYKRVLKPSGLMIFNLSNRYYDLETAVASTVAQLDLQAVRRGYTPGADEVLHAAATASLWMVVGSESDVARFRAREWTPIDGRGPVLTDDYPDITRVLRWGR